MSNRASRGLGVELSVSKVIEETGDARSLVFDVPEALAEDFKYVPGQFLTLNVPSDLEPTARCYSLASSPHRDLELKVTVKRTASGYASNWLCDQKKVPFTLEVLRPSGAFTPAGLDGEFALFAGGSGITPVISIIKSVLHSGAGRCRLFYANRDASSIIFARELAGMADEFGDRFEVEYWNEDERGLPAFDALVTTIRGLRSPEVFTCGPAPFMALVKKAAAEVGLEHGQVHIEEFKSLSGDPFAPIEQLNATDESSSTVEVDLDGEHYSLAWPANRTLVDVMLNADIDVPYSCREGECGSCVCTLTEGSVDPGSNGLLDEEDIADGIVLGCQIKPTSEHVKVEF